MGFILEPRTGDDLIINGWNWRPTVAFLVREGIIPSGERAERCLANGCGGHLSQSEAISAADQIDELIEGMDPNQRLLHDGEITDKPIDYEKPVSECKESDPRNEATFHYAEAVLAWLHAQMPPDDRYPELTELWGEKRPE